MVESLIAGKAILVNVDDRTQVINLKQWNITKEDIIHIYDQGGHMIYTITSPLFITRDSLLFIVHDLTKVKPKDTAKTTEVLRHALHQYPQNTLYIILTHIDLLQADHMAWNRDVIMEKLTQFLDDEISSLKKLLRQKKVAKENKDIIDDTNNLLTVFEARRSNLPFFCVSSQNYSGMKEVKDCLVDALDEKRAVIPESWVKFYKRITGIQKIYMTLDETAYHFKVATHARPDSDIVGPLQYFADTNLFLHYENNPFLKDFVFHDIDLLADLFKSLFHHNIGQVINYDSNEKLQEKFKKHECDLAVQRYKREGLLGRKLLSYLWEHYGVSFEDETVLLRLMQSFNLCYSVSKDDALHFFPWFVESQECPAHIDRDNIMKFDKTHGSVHLQYEFFNRIPLNVFEMVSVCLQRKATHECHYMGDRQAWHDGLEISFGSVRCVLIRSNSNSTIDLCLHGKVDDMPLVWKVVESLLKDLQAILKPWQGVLRSIHFVCGHCVILCISPPHHWLPEQVFPSKDVLVPAFVACPRMATLWNIPAALLIAYFKGEFHFYLPENGFLSFS